MDHQKPNFSKMLQLIDEVFATRSDPDQIEVNPQQLKKLQAIHPATLTQLENEDGPMIWILMIPTTTTIINQFMQKKISERELLERTNPKSVFDCIYLCSATTLPEYRGKGDTKKLCLSAIEKICTDHPINTLAVWPFSEAGEKLAVRLASELGLLLLRRN